MTAPVVSACVTTLLAHGCESYAESLKAGALPLLARVLAAEGGFEPDVRVAACAVLRNLTRVPDVNPAEDDCEKAIPELLRTITFFEEMPARHARPDGIDVACEALANIFHCVSAACKDRWAPHAIPLIAGVLDKHSPRDLPINGPGRYPSPEVTSLCESACGALWTITALDGGVDAARRDGAALAVPSLAFALPAFQVPELLGPSDADGEGGNEVDGGGGGGGGEGSDDEEAGDGSDGSGAVASFSAAWRDTGEREGALKEYERLCLYACGALKNIAAMGAASRKALDEGGAIGALYKAATMAGTRVQSEALSALVLLAPVFTAHAKALSSAKRALAAARGTGAAAAAEGAALHCARVAFVAFATHRLEPVLRNKDFGATFAEACADAGAPAALLELLVQEDSDGVDVLNSFQASRVLWGLGEASPASAAAVARAAAEALPTATADAICSIAAVFYPASNADAPFFADAAVDAGAAPALVAALRRSSPADGAAILELCKAIGMIAAGSGAPGPQRAARIAAFAAAGAEEALRALQAGVPLAEPFEYYGLDDEEEDGAALPRALQDTLDLLLQKPPARLYLVTLPRAQLQARLASCLECWLGGKECPRSVGATAGAGADPHSEQHACYCMEAGATLAWAALPCGHLAHMRCLMKWAALKTEGARAAAVLPSGTCVPCPHCRRVVTQVRRLEDAATALDGEQLEEVQQPPSSAENSPDA